MKLLVAVCRVLSGALVLAFVGFAIHSLRLGVTKETLYAGPVGYWLGVYLLFASACSMGCLIATAWLAVGRHSEWKTCARTFSVAVTLTLVSYAGWNWLVQGRL